MGPGASALLGREKEFQISSDYTPAHFRTCNVMSRGE